MLICNRCHNPVPSDRIACQCFILTADREAHDLALRRFWAGEAPLFEHSGHVYPDRKQAISVCGLDAISNRKDDPNGVRVLRMVDFKPDKVRCEKCRDVVINAIGDE